MSPSVTDFFTWCNVVKGLSILDHVLILHSFFIDEFLFVSTYFVYPDVSLMDI